MHRPAFPVPLLLLGLLVGCTGWKGERSDSPIVARAGDAEITLEELDAYVRESLFQERTRGGAPAEVFELRSRALDELLEQLVLEQTARERGTTVEALLAAERQPVPDAEVRAFYEDNRDRLGEVPFEELAPHIRGRLEEQAQRAWIDELVAAADVDVALQPPRFDVVPSGPFLGPADAPVAIVEFSDFECPFCRRALSTVEALRERYPEQVRIHYRHLPLESIHPHAREAAEASVCAEAQGRFWEFHDLLFENQRALAPADLRRWAAEAGLDLEAYDRCVAAREGRARVDADVAAARAAGITGTPAFFVNGLLLRGALPTAAFERVIDRELASGDAGLTRP